MAEKKITPVTFSAETFEKNEQVGVKPINRAAPVDSGSGSGGGSGSGAGFGSPAGVLTIISGTVPGCEWQADCNFNWDVNYEYRKEGQQKVLYVHLYFTNIQAACRGGSSVRIGNVEYSPFSHVFSSYKGCQTFAVKEDEQEFEFDLSFTETFKISAVTYHGGVKEPTTSILTENLSIPIKVTFRVRPNYNSTQIPDIIY